VKTLEYCDLSSKKKEDVKSRVVRGELHQFEVMAPQYFLADQSSLMAVLEGVVVRNIHCSGSDVWVYRTCLDWKRPKDEGFAETVGSLALVDVSDGNIEVGALATSDWVVDTTVDELGFDRVASTVTVEGDYMED
jgi:hypothetical protein